MALLTHLGEHPRPPDAVPDTPLRLPDDDSIPRLETWQLHSQNRPQPEHRPILVYLPEAYTAEPTRRFPVFYLQDGQNLFDGRTSYVAGRTWRAHITADALSAAQQIEPVILVGIANAGLGRMAEYTPTRDPQMGGGEGRAYAAMLVEELKPFIDRTYRTLPSPENTAVGGSSLGGLISLFLGFDRPSTFGKLGVLSPSLWWNHRAILSFVNRTHPVPRPRIWLDMGTAEGARHLRDTIDLYRLLLRLGWSNNQDLRYLEVEGAVHDEAAWANRFDQVLRFLFPPR